MENAYKTEDQRFLFPSIIQYYHFSFIFQLHDRKTSLLLYFAFLWLPVRLYIFLCVYDIHTASISLACISLSDENLPHFFLMFWWMCMCAKLFQSQPIPCDHMDYGLPGSSVHGILQARILEWVVMTFSRNWHAKYLLLLLSFSCSVVPALCDPTDCSTPGFPVFTISQSLFKLMSIESVIPSNHFILCCPLLLPPSIFTNICVFSNELALRIRWPKYWSVSFSISHSNEYSGLISFRIQWLGLLQSKGLSRVFSNTTVQKNQFFGTQPSLWSNSHIHIWLLKKQ